MTGDHRERVAGRFDAGVLRCIRSHLDNRDMPVVSVKILPDRIRPERLALLTDTVSHQRLEPPTTHDIIGGLRVR